MDVKQSGSAGSTKIDCDNCPGKSLLGGGAISLSHVYKQGSSTLVSGVVDSNFSVLHTALLRERYSFTQDNTLGNLITLSGHTWCHRQQIPAEGDGGGWE